MDYYRECNCRVVRRCLVKKSCFLQGLNLTVSSASELRVADLPARPTLRHVRAPHPPRGRCRHAAAIRRPPCQMLAEPFAAGARQARHNQSEQHYRRVGQ
jgi:hypothetical protein